MKLTSNLTVQLLIGEKVGVLTVGDIVEKHIKMKDSIFSAECIYGLNEIGGQRGSLMSHMWPSSRREMMYSRVNLVSVFHRHLLSTEVGIVVLVPDSGGYHISMGNGAACFHFFVSKINWLVSHLQACNSFILMLQGWMCLSSILTSE